MEIKSIKIKDLKKAEYNPRTMNNEEIEKLKNSIKEFGLVEPVVVNKDLTIIGGHQRVKAMEELKMEEIPCIIVDLDKKKEKILNLALNRIVGNWNERKLAELIKEVSEYPEIAIAGFDKDEIEMLNVQYDLIYDDNKAKVDPYDEEAIEKMFERNESIEVPVERPQVVVKKDKIAFYVRNMDQWKVINEKFKTPRKGELDIDKLVELAKK